MTKELNCIDVVLSIFNQEKLIERVLYGIFVNTTTPFNLIIIFDGCTDRTEARALRYIDRYKPPLLKKLVIDHAKNVFETKANNIGFRKASEDYLITLQDDMVINEFGWEKRLTYPLRKFDDVIAVSSRIAQNLKKIEDFDNQEIFMNQVGREFGNLPRNIFAVRDTINRGPIAFNTKHLKSMNYLNERYAPSDLDDADLCLRAWKEKKLRCGAYWIGYISRLEWGKARAKDSTMLSSGTIRKNILNIKNDHGDYIQTGLKHDVDVLIDENLIDYDRLIQRKRIRSLLTYPIRLDKKDIEKMVKSIVKRIIR